MVGKNRPASLSVQNGDGQQGSYIIVPPNGLSYADPEVILRLEQFVSRRLPMLDIEVAWVVQPRISTFTVVERNDNLEILGIRDRDQILAVLDDFDPLAPGSSVS